jgi:hypothetical protein
MSKYQVQARIHPTHWAHSIDKGVIHLEFVVEDTDEVAAREKAKMVLYDNDYEVHSDEIDIHEIDAIVEIQDLA